MQTFLPYADFARSAAVLDDRRLGKQRVEGIQIVRALTVPAYAWKSHPAVLMWGGYEEALEAYLVAVCDEWAARGFDDTCRQTIRADLAGAGVAGPSPQQRMEEAGRLPPWLGDETLHRSHRASLLRKDPDHYGQFFGGEAFDDVEGYYWPVRSPKALAAEAAKRARAAARAERLAGRRAG